MSLSQPVQLLTCIEGPAETTVVELISTSDSLVVARRCVDLAEVLGAAAAGRGAVVLVSAFLPGLDTVTVADLRRRGLNLLGVHDDCDVAGSDQALARFAALGIDCTVAAAEPLEAMELERAVRRCAESGFALNRQQPAPELAPDSDAMWKELDKNPASVSTRVPGTVVTVWGPVGGPGRTTIAVQLAARLARSGRRVLLVDADTYGASVAQLLDIVEEAPGVAAACRMAHSGTLSLGTLCFLAPTVMPNLHVLTGIPRADRWPEVTEVGLARLWEVARDFADVTIVDAGFCLESDDLGDSFGPRRNSATLSALEHADAVAAVGICDDVGLSRLVRGTAQLRHVTTAPIVAVANRLRRRVVGTQAAAQVACALEGLVVAVVTIDDDPAVDTSAHNGVAGLGRHARTALTQGVNGLANELVRAGGLNATGVAAAPRRRVRWRGRMMR